MFISVPGKPPHGKAFGDLLRHGRQRTKNAYSFLRERCISSLVKTDMTTASLREGFDLIIDEAGSAYFSDSQVANFLTQAQRAVIKKLVDPDQAPGGVAVMGQNAFYESSQKVGRLLAPFTVVGAGVSMTRGAIRNWTDSVVFEGGGASIESRLVNIGGAIPSYIVKGMSFYPAPATGDISPDDISADEYRPGMWLRKAEVAMRDTMDLFTATTCNWTWHVANGDGLPIFVRPMQPRFYYLATIVVLPPDITLSLGETTAMPEEFRNNIIFTAARLAAISMRDRELEQSIMGAALSMGI